MNKSEIKWILIGLNLLLAVYVSQESARAETCGFLANGPIVKGNDSSSVTQQTPSAVSSAAQCEPSHELTEASPPESPVLEKEIEQLKDKITDLDHQTVLLRPLNQIGELNSNKDLMAKLKELNKRDAVATAELAKWASGNLSDPNQARRKIYNALQILTQSLANYKRGRSLSKETARSKRPQLQNALKGLIDSAYLDKDLWSCIVQKTSSDKDKAFAATFTPVDIDLLKVADSKSKDQSKIKDESEVIGQLERDLFSSRGQDAFVVGLDGGEDVVSFGAMYDERAKAEMKKMAYLASAPKKGKTTEIKIDPAPIKEKLGREIIEKMVSQIKKSGIPSKDLEKQLDQIFKFSDATKSISDDDARRARKFALYSLNMVTQEGFNAFSIHMAGEGRLFQSKSVNTYIDLRRERRDEVSKSFIYGKATVSFLNMSTGKPDDKVYGVEYSAGTPLNVEDKKNENPLRIGTFQVIPYPSIPE